MSGDDFWKRYVIASAVCAVAVVTLILGVGYAAEAVGMGGDWLIVVAVLVGFPVGGLCPMWWASR